MVITFSQDILPLFSNELWYKIKIKNFLRINRCPKSKNNNKAISKTAFFMHHFQAVLSASSLVHWVKSKLHEIILCIKNAFLQLRSRQVQRLGMIKRIHFQHHHFPWKKVFRTLELENYQRYNFKLCEGLIGAKSYFCGAFLQWNFPSLSQDPNLVYVCTYVAIWFPENVYKK